MEATTEVSDVVEAMQGRLGAGPRLLGRPFAGLTRLFTGPVHRTIRGLTGLVGDELDAALARLGPLLGAAAPGPRREAALAILNGVLGDHLAATGNPLAIEMALRRGARPVLEASAPLDGVGDAARVRRAFPAPSGKVLVLVHGSCLCDRAWTRPDHDHGAALERDLGFTSVHVQYNTGLHVSTNGVALAALLERLVAAWPVDIEQLVLVGHSMGGLVARSACHAGDAASHRWRRTLRKLVCIGSPHHGAALERGGNWIDVLLGIHPYSAPLARLGKIRSAGVTDLRFGNVLEEHWRGRDRFGSGRDARERLQLPAGVECYAIAGTTTPAPGSRAPASDGLVAVDSALGRHRRPELTLEFPEAHQWIAYGIGHIELLGRPEVYAVLRGWLAEEGASRPSLPRDLP